ncbi:LysR family transcriptional regulator [Pseudomonas aeruginosa]
MKTSLNGIGVFVDVVEAGGFSAAASRLNLSRSAVGKTVARIESRLGVRLFHRTTRSQVLTDDGHIFYEHCLRALEELRTGEATLESGRKEAVGRLRVSMPVIFGRRCVAPILTTLAREHPKLELDLRFSERLVDVIEDGFDLVIRNGPTANGPGLVTRRIALQRMTVCAAPSYLEKHGMPQTLMDIADHEAVTCGREGHIRSWLFPQDDGKHLEVMPRSRMQFDDLSAIADAAVEGLGLAWLPCWLVRDQVRAGTLVPVLADLPGLVFETHALWPQSPHLPLRVRLAVDALVHALADNCEL